MPSAMAPINPIALDRLRLRLKTADVYVPGMNGYEEVLRRWSDTGMRPAASTRTTYNDDHFSNNLQGVVVQPIEVDDVPTALVWAQEHFIDVAVKGGGHSAAGTSSSDGGLVIDLSRMKNVTVDPDNKTLTVQGGATWKEVDDAAAQYGFAAVGGTVNHTGVGGLTLGGGYGWLSGQYGLVIDNLLSATVVIADGRILTASSTENEDLFWGLRGAGFNFGVVIDFTFRVHEQNGPVLCGVLLYKPEYLELVVSVLNEIPPNPKAAAMCIIRQPEGAPFPLVYVLPFYNGTLDEGMAHFGALWELGPIHDTVDARPYKEANGLQNPITEYGDRKCFKGVFYQPPLDPGFVRSMYEELAAKISQDSDLTESTIILEYFDTRKICEVAPHETAFASRNTIRNGILYLHWKDASKDNEHIAWGDSLQACWKAELESTSDDSNQVPQYINYAERKCTISLFVLWSMLTLMQRVTPWF